MTQEIFVMSVNTDNYQRNAKLRHVTDTGIPCSEGFVFKVDGTKLPYCYGAIVNGVLCAQRWSKTIEN